MVTFTPDDLARKVAWLHEFPEGAHLTVRRTDTGELAELENEGLPWCDWIPVLPEAIPVLSQWWQSPPGIDAPGLTPRRLAHLLLRDDLTVVTV